MQKVLNKIRYQLQVMKYAADPVTLLSLILMLYVYLFSFKRILRPPFRLVLRHRKIKFHCGPHLESYLVVSPQYETKTLKFFDSFNDFDVFIDIGAHVGKYSIYIAKKYPEKKVIAIEANPLTFSYLLKNIEVNKLKNIIPINVACHYKEGYATFYHSFNRVGGSSLMKEHIHERVLLPIKVRAKPLDKCLRSNKIKLSKNVKILIKIDVEGAELIVLKGARNIIRKYKPVILFEAWDKSKLEEVKNFLSKYNYRIRYLGDGYNYIAFK